MVHTHQTTCSTRSTRFSTRSTCFSTRSTHFSICGTCLFTCSTCLSICLPTRSICLSTHSICLSTCSVCLSTRSICLPTCSIYLSNRCTLSTICRSFLEYSRNLPEWKIDFYYLRYPNQCKEWMLLESYKQASSTFSHYNICIEPILDNGAWVYFLGAYFFKKGHFVCLHPQNRCHFQPFLMKMIFSKLRAVDLVR